MVSSRHVLAIESRDPDIKPDNPAASFQSMKGLFAGAAGIEQVPEHGGQTKS